MASRSPAAPARRAAANSPAAGPCPAGRCWPRWPSLRACPPWRCCRWWKWWTGPLPVPTSRAEASRSAPSSHGLTSRSAASQSPTRACTVAMAEDREQPVPWLLRVAIRSPGTTTVSWPSRPPVLTSASGQPSVVAVAGGVAVGAGAVGMPVPRPAALEVSALNQDSGAGQGGQPLALRQGLGPVGRDGLLEQDGEFGEVGRDEVRQRQEGLQGGLGGFLQEPVPAGGDHHRVQDHDGGAHLFQPDADGVDHGGVTEHADLDGVDADVVADGVQLRREERRRGNVDGAHALGVLRCQGGDGGHAVAAVRRDALQVGLDSGPAGGIGAGDGQHTGNARRAPAETRCAEN